MKPVHLSTCVWGPWHLDTLTRIVWPCLLAEGNLPVFMRECTATYRICTTRRDQAKLREAPVFQSISRLAPIEFIDIPTEDPQPQFHMDRFVTAMQEARQDGAIFFNLWPDVVFADRTLGNAAQAINDGKAGCILPSFRVVSETCVEDTITAFAKSPDAPISIPPGELVRLGARHLHPLSATGVANALHGRPDTGLLFRIRGEGFVSRSSWNWLFMDPERLGITADGAITTSHADPGRQVHIVTNSDDLFFLSLAPLYKELGTFRPHHSNDELDMARLTMLPHVKVSPFNDPIDRVCTRLHYGEMTKAAWQPVVHRSETIFRRVRMMRAFMQIWELLKKEGCRQAARLISLALFTLKLPNSFLIEQPLTIFVPDDTAVASFPRSSLSRLLDRKFRRDLLRIMLSHVVMEERVSSANSGAEYRSVAGGQIRLWADGGEVRVNETARVLKELRCGPHRIFVIDQVLDPGAFVQRARRSRRP